MSILHITTGSYVIIGSYIRFVNENFDQDLHRFLIVGQKQKAPTELLQYNNVKIINIDDNKAFRTMLNYMRDTEIVLLHSLFFLSAYNLLFLLFHPKMFNNIVWIAWGADLYQWKKAETRFIKDKIINLIAYQFRRKIKYFVGIFSPDIDFFKKEFNSDAKTFYASYVGGLYNPLYKKELNLISLGQKRTSNSCINIQIGHSCATILNHIQVLNDLHKFKNENIKIYIPLSYGDMEYGNQVEQHAKTLFGDKVVCIRKMMSKEDYMDFLSTIDIAIFNTPRQIGLGNINPLLYMEKKIFIPNGTVMYEYYRSQNIKICDYSQINKLGFDRFSKPVDMKNAKQFIELHYRNKEITIDMWQRVFDLSIK